ncbi:MAG: ABC transporter ATP-binding protein [Actinomycetota bacterium]
MSEMTHPMLPEADGDAVRRHAGALVRERKRALVAVIGLLVVVTLAFSAIPAIIGAAVNLATTDGDRDDLRWLVAAMFGVTVLGVVGVMFGRYEAARFGESILDELRTRVYDAAVSLPGSIVESVGTGELVARATGDVETLSTATRTSLPSVLFSSVMAMGMTVALVIADWRLAVVGLSVGAAVAAPGVRWYVRNAGVRYRRERQADADRSAALLEHYTGRRTLWAFGAADVSHRVLDDRGAERRASQLATTAARNRLRPALRFGQAAALATVMGLGAYFLDQGSLSAGALTASSLYMLRLIDPVNTLLEQVDEVQQAKASLERIVGLIELSEAHERTATWPEDAAGARTSEPTGLPVSLRDVSFGYEPTRPVLESVDLDIPAGQRVLVVGPSGAGKSTLAGLICGTHDPWSGTVEVGGAVITGIRRDELRRRVALVTQETHVFARSVRDNVALGRPDATDDRIIAALEAADAWGWVRELDDGLDTLLTTNHPAITPARSQQLNLARIICLDPPVVVLDEAMADLSPDSAGRTERQLRTALAGRTLVAIAHRLDAAPAMDRVVMVADGRIVADGSHDELVSTASPYADLWHTWERARSGELR